LKVGSAIALTGMMLAGGFIARRVMVVAADRLEKEISKTQRNVEQTQRNVEQTQRNVEQTQQKVEQTQREVQSARAVTQQEFEDQKIITSAIAWIGGKHAQEHLRAVDELSALASRRPKDRAVAILLGRAYRKVGQLPQAIIALSQFITDVETDPDRKHAYADALYNRACYESLLAATGQSADLCASCRSGISTVS